MSLIIPNATDTTGGNKYDSLDQAEPDALDFEILSLRGSGVVSGCEVTSAGTNNTVNVAAGTIMLNGASYSVSAATGFGLPTAPADKRFDIVVARVSGGVASIVAVQGDNSATNPSFPKSASVITGSPSPTTNVILDTDVVLAAVYRNGSTTVTTSKITDKRVTVTTSIPDQGAAAPVTSYGSGSGALYYKTGTPSGTASGVYVKTSTGPWIELAQNVGPHIPIGGAILWPATGSVPSGYIEANGQFLSTSSYPALFAVYGYTHGGSAGSFRVPDYNNKFIRGTTNTALIGTTVGADTVTLTTSTLPSHYHDFSHVHDFAHSHGITHGHPGSTSDTESAHYHTINHDHAQFDTGLSGSHSHTATGSAGFIARPGGATGLYTMITASPTANDENYALANTTSTASSHDHTVNVPSYTGNSGTGGGHSHGLTIANYSGSTTSQSTSTTSVPTGSIATSNTGSGTPFSIIPAAAYGRWIICASLGTDPSFTGGITGPWSASQTVTTVSGAGIYTVLNSDIGNLIVTTSGLAVTLSLTTGLDMVAGQRIDIIQQGAGTITVSASGGPTVNGTPGLKTRAQYSKASIICVAADTYILEGDIAA